MPLINCEIEWILSWSKNFVLTNMTVKAAGNDNILATVVGPTELEFEIEDIKLYVPVVTLSAKNDKNLLEELQNGIITDHIYLNIL